MDEELKIVDGDIVDNPIDVAEVEAASDDILETEEELSDELDEDKIEHSSGAPRRIAVAKPEKAYTEKDFSEGKFVVYPTHGVGRFEGFEELSIGGQRMSLLKITFPQERLSVRLPVQKIREMGLRPVSSKGKMQSALDALSKKKRVGRKMWSRRAQEYEAKINSGDPVAVAEVVRDLFRRSSAVEQSFSERQLYKAALERFSRELAAVREIEEEDAIRQVENILEVAAA